MNKFTTTATATTFSLWLFWWFVVVVDHNVDALSLSFQVFSSISDIRADEWNQCCGTTSSSSNSNSNNNNIFAQYEWLKCLEESECASAQTGWQPQHIAVYNENKQEDEDKEEKQLVAFVPMYVKGHSMGEFIFDQAFADAASRAGISYYPKLLVGIPFTPATGERILINPEFLKDCESADPSTIRKGIANYLKQITVGNGLSSLHFNFITDDEATDMAGELDDTIGGATELDLKQQLFKDITQTKSAFVRRTSVQYHWDNIRPDGQNQDNQSPYESFEDYLSFFKSKKRINIRRERKKVFEDENIRVDAVAGLDILKYDGLLERMFEIYLSTIQKMYYGRQYLTIDFFKMLGKSSFIENTSNDVTQLYIVHLWKLISLRSIRQIKTKYNNKNIMVQFNLLIKILFGNKY